jgi:hypothetical protein
MQKGLSITRLDSDHRHRLEPSIVASANSTTAGHAGLPCDSSGMRARLSAFPFPCLAWPLLNARFSARMAVCFSPVQTNASSGKIATVWREPHRLQPMCRSLQHVPSTKFRRSFSWAYQWVASLELARRCCFTAHARHPQMGLTRQLRRSPKPPQSPETRHRRYHCHPENSTRSPEPRTAWGNGDFHPSASGHRPLAIRGSN